MQEENVHWPSAATRHFEDQHDIQVFSMRDYGSRAKNMDGPDSDIDAMFLFDQPASAHKRLGEYVDTIHTEEYGIDFQGWNLRKFANLLVDSNPQTIEFLNSPLRYQPETDQINNALEDLRHYANRNINPIRLYYHYQSMAENNYRKYILRKLIHNERGLQFIIESVDDGEYRVYSEGESFDGDTGLIYDEQVGEDREYRLATTDRSIKRNLVIIRAVLYARHIRRAKDFPTMDFYAFLDSHVDKEIDRQVKDLLLMKEDGLGQTPMSNKFKSLIESEINHEPENEDLNQAGIDQKRVNQFIDRIDGILYGNGTSS